MLQMHRAILKYNLQGGLRSRALQTVRHLTVGLQTPEPSQSKAGTAQSHTPTPNTFQYGEFVSLYDPSKQRYVRSL